MTRFAFVIHPLKPKDTARKYPIARYVPDAAIEWFLARKGPVVASRVTGVRSITGSETDGWFIGCPLTPDMMTSRLPLEAVYERIVQCTELAAKLGAQIVGLGAFTSVVGDGGVTIAERSPIPVTTGNSYTVATAIEGLMRACDLVGIHAPESTLAVVGATGSIGRTCAVMLAPQFGRTVLVGRDVARTQALADEVGASASDRVGAIAEADAVLTVTSAEGAIIQPGDLRRGAVVCDVARPRDVSVRVARERPDVLVIEGGIVSVPGPVEFGIDFGFPPRAAYACMSETMMLALEGRLESFTLGKSVSVEQVEETRRMASRHGFELAGFRSFERAVDDAEIERIRALRAQPAPV